MIRMIQSRSEKQAKAYFSDSLSKSDYYLDEQELPGKFHGKIADRLGVDEHVKKEIFFSLCENRNPKTGLPLTQRTKQGRTVGYDINFHCPKSVSILHALSNDDHLLDAFRQSVSDTMLDIEMDAKTRIRAGGLYDDRQTGELLWSDFTHQTARPVDGHTPDPHLHSHCFVFNVTWDQEEQKLKAGQFRDIKRDMPYYQARFHKRFSDRLIDLGYQINRTSKSFEVSGVPQKVIDLFSKRTDEIGRVAKEKGITNKKDLDNLGAYTRSKKQKGLSMSDLIKDWKKQIHAVSELEAGNRIIRNAPRRKKIKIRPKDCIDPAIQHSFERASVMPERRILETAYRQGLCDSSVSLEQITEVFHKNKNIIQVKENSLTLCTTQEVLLEEKRMIELAQDGKGKLQPLYKQAPTIKLEGQQAEAVKHILTTDDRVSIIRGGAGTGKTTLMREAVQHIKQAGKKVIVVAPTANASRGVLRDEGFEEAETVSKLLIDRTLQDNLTDNVLWVDEAGLLGTKDMKDILELVTRKNARIILGGDTRQHASVVRGDALRVLNSVAGINVSEVDKIYRQKNKEYREVVEKLSNGNIATAFQKLDAMGAIKNIDPMKPNETLIHDYMKAVKKRKSVLIISPTHKQGDDLTIDLRNELRNAGMIGKKEIEVTKLNNLNFTEAEKKDWRNFKEGQIIKFNQNIPGIKRGSAWEIESAAKDKIQFKNSEGKTIRLPLDELKNFDLYQKSEIGLSKGDKVNITRNGFDQNKKRLNNGLSLEVISVNKTGEILLQNKASKVTYSLNKDHGHISHAYCVTSHASQGKTVDEVFISQPASTFPATDAKQFYVSVSRARNNAMIYTEDKIALLQSVLEIGNRQSAIELFTRKNTLDVSN